jgi:hypothetical protein
MGSTPTTTAIEGVMLDRLFERSRFLHYIDSSADGTIRACSEAVFRTLRRASAAVIGQSLWPFLLPSDAEGVRVRLADPGVATQPFLVNLLDVANLPRTLMCFVDPTTDGFVMSGEPVEEHEWKFHEEALRLNNELSVLLRDNVQKTRALEAALAELDTSYWHLKKIQEVLPICMECGKVKTSESHWEDVAKYLRENSLFLSHGYCPACAAGQHAACEAEIRR